MPTLSNSIILMYLTIINTALDITKIFTGRRPEEELLWYGSS